MTPEEIEDRDQALIVLESHPPSDRWFEAWEKWFVRKAGSKKENAVRILFAYARTGASTKQGARELAKVELAKMLESIASQVRQGVTSENLDDR